MANINNLGESLVVVQLNDLKDVIRGIVNDCLDAHVNPPKEEDELLSIEEVANLLGVSKVTIHHRKRMGKIPFYRSGRRIYFKKSEVLASLQSSKDVGLRGRGK